MRCFLCGQQFTDGQLMSLAEHLIEGHNWLRNGCACGQVFRKAETIATHLQKFGIQDAASYDEHVREQSVLRQLVNRVFQQPQVLTRTPVHMGDVRVDVVVKKYRFHNTEHWVASSAMIEVTVAVGSRKFKDSDTLPEKIGSCRLVQFDLEMSRSEAKRKLLNTINHMIHKERACKVTATLQNLGEDCRGPRIAGFRTGQWRTQ